MKNTATAGAADEAAFLRRLLDEARNPLRLDELLRIGGILRRRKGQVRSALEELARQGHILRMRGGLWTSAKLVRTVVGPYTTQLSGAGFVTPRDGEISSKKRRDRPRGGPPELVFIHPSQAGEAWHGDMVRAALLPGRGAPQGRILEILERGRKELAVRVLPEKGAEKLSGSAREERAALLCKPADPRFPFLLQVDVSALPAPPLPDDLLLARIGEKLASKLWQGEALASFGREDDVAVQERLVKLNHQAPMEFPRNVLDAAAALPPEPTPHDMAGREDLRSVPFATIDGVDARDFDDAVHVERRGLGWLLRVGVADVAHYVRPRSPLDLEARERGNSWYFPASVEPMLPPVLSTGLCSLNPHADRLIMLAEIPFNAHGEPGPPRFAAAVMRSAARLAYGQVQRAMLECAAEDRADIAAMPRGGEVLPMLEEAVRLARVLAARRTARGSLDFNLPEPEYAFAADGRIADIRRKERHFAHQIIEEFMIAANEAVARFLEEKNLPFLYRTHPEPEPLRLDGLRRALLSTPLAASLPARGDAGLLRAALAAAQGGPQEFLTGRLALRAMPQARYQPDNEGHFGLASACYCHFTSPIRRYADLVVHRALKRALGLDPGPIPTAGKLLALSDALNRRERAAMAAEREMARRLAVLMLRDRVGEEFSGVIAGVTDFGFFVELDAMPVEGMVRMADLGDDHFEYDPERQELRGMLSGVRFGLGQRVLTRLEEVDAGRLEIALTPAGNPPGRAARRPGRASARTSKEAGGRPSRRKRRGQPAPAHRERSKKS